jgi:hypothetical protein
MINKEFIVVKKLCEKKRVNLDISIYYDKPKCGE